MTTRITGHNSSYKKLAIQLNGALCFVSSAVLADSLVLRNRQLLVAANQRFRFGWLIFARASLKRSAVVAPSANHFLRKDAGAYYFHH